MTGTNPASRIAWDVAAGKPSGPLAAVPGVSIPCGFSNGGLPVGLRLMGPLFGETTLLQAARLYERETGWHARRPLLGA